jgi:hypothetical protein
MVMNIFTVNTTLEIPPEIATGLADGIYERIGGVIREVGSKHVVAWLREIPSVSLNPLASVLNLSVSVMGFAVVLQKLNHLEGILKRNQQLLEKVDRKIDLGFHANFRAALDSAINACTMNQPENKKATAIQAINRFLEAEHVFLGCTEQELQKRSQIAEEYLLILSLSYIAEVRCHLELEEIETAFRRLQEGAEKIRPLARKYVEMLLTSNPAVYLHPQFKQKIGLKKLTKVYQWIDPKLDEAAVFELQRDNLFSLAKDQGSESGYKWVTSLPKAIVCETEIQGNLWNVFGNKEEMKVAAMNRLPKSFEKIESMIEAMQRFESYQLEVKAISHLGLTFQEWQQMSVSTEEQLTGNLIYCIPPKPINPKLSMFIKFGKGAFG